MHNQKRGGWKPVRLKRAGRQVLNLLPRLQDSNDVDFRSQLGHVTLQNRRRQGGDKRRSLGIPHRPWVAATAITYALLRIDTSLIESLVYSLEVI